MHLPVRRRPLEPTLLVPGDPPVVDDRLLDQRIVGEEPLPVGLESPAAAGREDRHLRRFGLTLVLVEGIEVALDDVTENMSHAQAAARLSTPSRNAFVSRKNVSGSSANERCEQSGTICNSDPAIASWISRACSGRSSSCSPEITSAGLSISPRRSITDQSFSVPTTVNSLGPFMYV